MFKYLTVATLCALAALHSVDAAAAPVDCSKVSEALDDLGGAQGLTTLNPNHKLWLTADELTARCKQMSEALLQLKKYNSQCFTALTKQVFSAIIETRSQMNEAVCKPDSADFKSAVEASKCIQEQAFASVQEAERKTILASQVLVEANIPDEKLRLRRACCSVLASRTNFLEATKAKCSAHQDVYTKYVDSYTSDAMGLICPEADKLECNKLEAIKTDGAEPKSIFFLNPMLKLVKSLDH